MRIRIQASGKFLQQQQRQAMRQRLDEMELRGLHPGEHALGDALVVHRIGDIVAGRRARAVAWDLQIDHHGLRNAPLPVDEADDAFGRQSLQKNAVFTHAGILSARPASVPGTPAPRAARRHAPRPQAACARRPAGAAGLPSRSSRRLSVQKASRGKYTRAPMPLRLGGNPLTQREVRAHAAGHHQRFVTGELQRPDRLDAQGVHDRRLHGQGQIGPPVVRRRLGLRGLRGRRCAPPATLRSSARRS